MDAFAAYEIIDDLPDFATWNRGGLLALAPIVFAKRYLDQVGFAPVVFVESVEEGHEGLAGVRKRMCGQRILVENAWQQRFHLTAKDLVIGAQPDDLVRQVRLLIDHGLHVAAGFFQFHEPQQMPLQ